MQHLEASLASARVSAMPLTPSKGGRRSAPATPGRNESPPEDAGDEAALATAVSAAVAAAEVGLLARGLGLFSVEYGRAFSGRSFGFCGGQGFYDEACTRK